MHFELSQMDAVYVASHAQERISKCTIAYLRGELSPEQYHSALDKELLRVVRMLLPDTHTK